MTKLFCKGSIFGGALIRRKELSRAERKYRLQECRKAAGYKSAREFAEAIGMPVRTYTNYEQEDRDLTLGLAMQFAEAMGCTIDQIAGRES